MTEHVFYTPGGSAALVYAQKKLEEKGVVITTDPHKGVTHLLLGAPAFHDDGSLRGVPSAEGIWEQLSPDLTVIGGNLNSPVLEQYTTIDLLQDPTYLAINADITAYCAIMLAMEKLPVILRDCPVLIVGWGRIGKCLSRHLQDLGADVTVAARKETDRAMISALGYTACDTVDLESHLGNCRVLFNTVPEMILSETQMRHCPSNCLKIELASRPGIAGEDVVQARGLPGKYAPESSGALIAESVLRLTNRR